MKLASFAVMLLAVTTGASAFTEADRGQLLTKQFGELCTVCEAKLMCRTEDGVETLYAFGQRSFISQALTILDYFPWVGAGKTHTRPVSVSSTGGGMPHGGTPYDGTARLSLPAARIEVPDIAGQPTWIDRRTGAWHGAGDRVIGACKVPDAPASGGPA